MFSCDSNNLTVPLLHVGFFYVPFFQSVQRTTNPLLPQRSSQQSPSIAGDPKRHNDEMDSAPLQLLDL